MPSRSMLAGVIVIATVAFAIGVSLEDSEESSEPAAAEAAHVESGAEESEAKESEEESGSEVAHSEESEAEEETVLGINLEATPFVVLAVIFSLALALAVYLRPDAGQLLVFVAIAMAAFAILDVREVFHQADESNDGLAVLAGVVAALHAGGALIAVRLLGRGGDAITA